jgi:hypothetical protein
VEVRADGTVLVDKVGEKPVVVHQGQAPAHVVAALDKVVTSELVALLDSHQTGCLPVEDFFQELAVTVNGVTHETGVTLCDNPVIVAVRNALGAAEIEALPIDTFVSFKYTHAAGLCPPTSHCSGSIEVDANGTVLVDKMGEIGGQIHEAKASAEQLAAILPVITAPALVDLLTLGHTPCIPPTDVFEEMSLQTADGGQLENSVTFCDQAPLVAARDALKQLATTLVP